jgi:(heptosyl)LPS beta-1,4-glucosyltransferase
MAHAALCDSADSTLRQRRSVRQAMHWESGLPSDLVEQLWYEPEQMLAQGQTLQHKPRCTVVRLEHSTGSYLLKQHSWGGPIRTLKKSLRRAPAVQCWLDGRFLAAAGVPTPQPRACLQRRLGPIGAASYLLTDFILGATLYRHLRFRPPSADALQRLAEQVAAIWQQLDDLQVTHNDLKTENFQIDAAGKLWLIDLEKMRRHKRREELRKRQEIDLRRFFHSRNWRRHPADAEVFRQRILQTPAAARLAPGIGGAQHPLLTPRPNANRPQELLTVLIPCRNSALDIHSCLESLLDFADEILIADCGSTDGTPAMIREMLVRHTDQSANPRCVVLECNAADEAQFLNQAILQAKHPWVLKVLPKERLSPELGKEIQDVLAADPRVNGFLITRRYYFWGHLVKLGGFRHDARLRLFRRDAAQFAMRDGELEFVPRSRNLGHLHSQLLLEACTALDRHLVQMIEHAHRTAEHRKAIGRRANFAAACWQGPWTFLRSFLLRGGWLNGWTGFHAAWLAALAVYLREAKLWELNQIVSTLHLAKVDRLSQLGLTSDETSSDLLGDAQTLRFTQPQSAIVAPDNQEARRAAA